MWNCKNCSENVEENFDVCWNCNFDKNGEKVDTSLEEEIKESYFNSSDTDKDLQLNPLKIIEAGKDIKSVVRYILLVYACSVIGIVISTVSSDRMTVTMSSFTIIIISRICNILILYKLYSAGDKLENSVKN